MKSPQTRSGGENRSWKMDQSEAPDADAVGKLRGRPFAPGRSGDPDGRPRGARNKTTVFAAQLLEGEAEALLRKLVEKALAGDIATLRLCVDRLLPPRRDRLVTFALPRIGTAKDACAASAAILAACANGELSLGEAAELMDLVATHVRMLDTTERETRLAALEAAKTPP
jgi:hypothetical protein